MEGKSTEKTVKAVKKGIAFKPVVFKSLEAYSEEFASEKRAYVLRKGFFTKTLNSRLATGIY